MNEFNGSKSKKLLRARDGRLVAGVASGLGTYFGIDANLVRLGFGVLTLFYGLGALLYLIAWAILPEESGDGQEKSIVEDFITRHRPLSPATSRNRPRPLAAAHLAPARGERGGGAQADQAGDAHGLGRPEGAGDGAAPDDAKSLCRVQA